MAPFALIAVVTVIDINVPPEVHLGPFLVAAPALTASFAGPRMTAFVGVVAVLAQAAVALARSSITDLNHMYQIVALFLISAIVTFFARLRERNAAEMVQLRTVAEAAQRSVLRPCPCAAGPCTSPRSTWRPRRARSWAVTCSLRRGRRRAPA